MDQEKSIFEVELDPRAKEVLAKTIGDSSCLDAVEGPVGPSAFHNATHVHQNRIQGLLREVALHQGDLQVPLRISISLGGQ